MHSVEEITSAQTTVEKIMTMYFSLDSVIRIDLGTGGQGIVTVNGERIGHLHVTERVASLWIKEVLFGNNYPFPRAPRPFKTRLPVEADILERSRQTFYVTLYGTKVGGGHRSLKEARKAFEAFYGVPFEGDVAKPTDADMRDLEAFPD